MAFRYRLYSADGDDLGEFMTAVPNWQPGERFFTGDGRRFEITRIVDIDEPGSPFKGFFEVTLLDPGRRR
jgi:hypothetical protein